MKTLLLALVLSIPAIVMAQEDKVFVFLNSKPDKQEIPEEETEQLMKQHLANIEQMAADGKLLVAGPFEGGGGIFIFNTTDVGLTKAWLQSDPAIKANRWDIEVFKISFMKGGACLAEEPYEMVTYDFTRVNYINDIANYKMNNSDIQGWQEAVKEETVLAVGRFPQYDGGLIIATGGAKPSWHNSFSDDQVSLEAKKLWIAKGSFCE